MVRKDSEASLARTSIPMGVIKETRGSEVNDPLTEKLARIGRRSQEDTTARRQAVFARLQDRDPACLEFLKTLSQTFGRPHEREVQIQIDGFSYGRFEIYEVAKTRQAFPVDEQGWPGHVVSPSPYLRPRASRRGKAAERRELERPK